ncbi:tRNA (adenosine(37)-N6)-threonylcarbamoyltransferase complex ATPase subunit type 1 TsaE [Pseudomonadota bacterium]|nr:tRNA (adenosine(37)-N6)-threonylcarbamoyltransferase complex ATPase subunit type 1 TsaE [Pseudomonadota bacterium]
MLKLRLKNESKTLLLGAAIGSTIKNLDFKNFEIHLNGNLGAGKTTLVRGVLQNLSWRDVVTSPSYTLCEEYEIDGRVFLHIDLYRINSIEDVEILNLDREIAMPKIIFIEWPENLQADRNEDVIIDLEHDNQARHASIECKDTNIESSIKTYYENE